MEACSESTPMSRPIPSSRLVTRVIRTLRHHTDTISVMIYVTSLILVLFFPILAKETYVDENAILPGSAAPAFGQQEAIDVEGLVAEVQTAVRKSKDGYSP